MIIISCSGKFHAFNLAEQLEKQALLSSLFTTYAYEKNTWMRRFAGRVDREKIPAGKTETLVPLAMLTKMKASPHVVNDLFDRWVAAKLKGRQDYKMFIGWSGMSLRALRQAKQAGKITVLERGSAHIQFQDDILKAEFEKFGLPFRIDPRTIEKELMEYDEADYISIPSDFVRKSFLEQGTPAEKLVVNPYGSSSYFKNAQPVEAAKGKFRVLFLGSLIIRKGLIYLFQALEQLNISPEKLEVWFIGKVDVEMKSTVEKYARPNWKFFGHVNHYELPGYLAACDAGVQPSLEDGYGMTILQMLACGVPVIASENTGGKDALEEGKNGFIVPVRDPAAIAERLQFLHDHPERLAKMKAAAAQSGGQEWTWDSYGQRYTDFISEVTQPIRQWERG